MNTMRRLLLIFVAVSMASCAYFAAEHERLVARHTKTCKRLDADPSSLIEQTVARPEQVPLSSSEQAHRERPRGSLSKSEVKRVAYANESDVRDCYEDALRSWRYANGRVVVKFVIDRYGDVEEVAIEADSTGIEPLACCIAEAVRSWRFPEPVGGGPVVVSYPFVLQPRF